ncbi:MAG: hypothetical protein V1726_06225 [Methanobacteriota archaeon]
MKKKIIVTTLITLLLLTIFPILSTSAYHYQIDTQHTSYTILPDTQTNDSEAQNLFIEEILESITINDLISILKNQLQNTSLAHQPTTPLLLQSLDQSTQTFTELGIYPTTNLRETQTILNTEIINQNKIKYRPFLFNVLPWITTVSTILPTYNINLTELPTPLGNLTVKLEVFMKIIPVLDRITTRQFGIITPRLTQSSTIWPAIGGRITVSGITLVIIAFGPRIKWTRGESTNEQKTKFSLK